MDSNDDDIRVGSPDLQEIKAYFSHCIRQEDIDIKESRSDSESRYGNKSESEDDLDASFEKFLSDAKQKLANNRDCSYVRHSSSIFAHSNSATEPLEASILMGTPEMAEMKKHLQSSFNGRANDSTMITSSPDIEPSFEEFLNARKEHLANGKIDIQDGKGIDEKVTSNEEQVSQEDGAIQEASILLMGTPGMAERQCTPKVHGNESTMTTSTPDIDPSFEELLDAKEESQVKDEIVINDGEGIDMKVAVKDEQVSQDSEQDQEASQDSEGIDMKVAVKDEQVSQDSEQDQEASQDMDISMSEEDR